MKLTSHQHQVTWYFGMLSAHTSVRLSKLLQREHGSRPRLVRLPSMLEWPASRVGLTQLPGRLPELVQNLIWNPVKVSFLTLKRSRGGVVFGWSSPSRKAIDNLRAFWTARAGDDVHLEHNSLVALHDTAQRACQGYRILPAKSRRYRLARGQTSLLV